MLFTAAAVAAAVVVVAAYLAVALRGDGDGDGVGRGYDGVVWILIFARCRRLRGLFAARRTVAFITSSGPKEGE